tara:strand:+ start:631 stop:1248 length:618 start_codon:yes stop_codon:yes gene_type:complete
MSKNYRKIWEMHNGTIPTDDKGRRYEIHHIDGNRLNNSIENLMCVSIEDHFKIHNEQGDYVEAALIAKRMRNFQTMRMLIDQARKEGKFTLQDEEKFYNIHIEATEKIKGTKYYNDGKRNYRLRPDDPFTEFLQQGMLKKHYRANGTKWYYDDVKCYRLYPDDPAIEKLNLRKGKPEKRNYDLLSDREKVIYLEKVIKKLTTKKI